MTIIDNHTGAPHFWIEQAGPEGIPLNVLIVRATFDFVEHGEPMVFSKVQRPIVLGDKFAGPANIDPLRAVIEDDGDVLPFKPGTDILVTGHARAPSGRAQTEWLASLRVGPKIKILRLHGHRRFRKRWFGWRLDPTEPVDRIPLDYRLAYGGCIDVPARLTGDGKAESIKHPANPAGCGWLPKPAVYKQLSKPARQYVAKWVREQKVLAAPQIEAASAPVLHPFHELGPQGFSAIARWWAPRQAHQGTCDDHWRNGRYPLLPEDFDSRYYQSAHPDLVCTPHLARNEVVTLDGLLPEKREMRLPGWRLVAVVTRASGASTVCFPVLDTVRFDLDRAEASLVWRAHFDRNDPVVEIALAATTAEIESDRSFAAATDEVSA